MHEIFKIFIFYRFSRIEFFKKHLYVFNHIVQEFFKSQISF